MCARTYAMNKDVCTKEMKYTRLKKSFVDHHAPHSVALEPEGNSIVHKNYELIEKHTIYHLFVKSARGSANGDENLLILVNSYRKFKGFFLRWNSK